MNDVSNSKSGRLSMAVGVIALVLGVLAGCGSDGQESQQDHNLPDVSQPDIRDSEAGDVGTKDSETSDAEDELDTCQVPPDCGDWGRLVGCKCVNKKDRRCQTDEDCRENEQCEDFGRAKVCMYEPGPVKTCPGSEGCSASEDGELRAGAASRIITPDGFETPTDKGVKDNNQMNFSPGPDIDDKWKDCGLDGLCPGDDGYPGPDKGENDGNLQGMWLAGYDPGRPAQTCPEERIGCDKPKCCVSKWAHDHLKSQVVVLERGETRLAFAVVDTLGLFRNDVDVIRQRLAEQGIEIDHLIMSATHNHEAPDTAGQWGPGSPLPEKSGRSPSFMNKVYDQTVEGIEDAVENLEPAKAEVAVLHPGLERLPMGDSRPPRIYDDNVPFLRLTEKQTGDSIGTIVSLGIHVEAMGRKNPYITSDYGHYFRKYLREGLDEVTDQNGDVVKPKLPGLGGVVAFVPGAVGGLISPDQSDVAGYDGEVREGSHKFAIADALGQRYAAPILEAVKNGEPTELEDTEISLASKRFLSPVKNRRFQMAAYRLGLFGRGMYNAARMGNDDFVPGLPHVLTEVSVVRLGPVTFFTAPGEVFPETLVGGFPGKQTAQDPIVGDGTGCDESGLPVENGDGEHPCIVDADQKNPPDWDKAPSGPYVYDKIPGEYPFFIGLGGDFLGYLVPKYDYEATNYITQPEGDHYEETNGVGPEIISDWKQNLGVCLERVSE